MTLVINMHGPSGESFQLQGEALPVHDKLDPPEIAVTITPSDLPKLQKGYSRLLRSGRAVEKVGQFSLDFKHQQGFTVSRLLDQGAVKLFALECRPFFLEKDPLSFHRLLNLESLRDEALRPWLKRLRQRWETSAFGGVMSIQVNGTKLDTHHVVQTWFNCDLFHSEPQKAEEFSLDALYKQMGGEQQAFGVLAHHLWASCLIISDYFENVAQMNAPFLAWALEEKARQSTRGTA
jgi:hypothetical protein